MLRRYQYVSMLVQQFAKERFGKIVIAVVLGMAMVATAFGPNAPMTNSAQAAPAQAHNASLASTISDVFGSDGPAAIRVATCESSMNPNAVNQTPIGGSHAQGLFQILYPSTWQGTSQASMSPFDARANAIAAHEIFMRDGHSWREWVCQP